MSSRPGAAAVHGNWARSSTAGFGYDAEDIDREIAADNQRADDLGRDDLQVQRTEPTREAVAQSAQLYRTMQQEKEAGQLVHVLRNGRLHMFDTLEEAKRLYDYETQG